MPDDELSDTERLHADYRRYDACVDIVSAAEVWFTSAAGIKDTVAHFERYPTIDHGDGEEATPDFTVLFHDGTAYVGELSNLARPQASIDSLCGQIGRYDSLQRIPGANDTLVDVEALDVIVFVPHGEANAAVARLADAVSDAEHFYKPSRFPSVFGWSFERERNRYIFSLARGDENNRPRGHGREETLEKWMASRTNPDTLTGRPDQFMRFKVARRFVNDPVPPLYMATLLWSVVLPRLNGGEGDIHTNAAEIAAQLRDDYGRGRANEVTHAFELLAKAGLAEREGEGWLIAHQSITRHDQDLAETLLDRYSSPPSGPVSLAARERIRKVRRERERNKARQMGLEEAD
jgi:hypothetical protein